MAQRPVVEIDRARIAELTEREQKRLDDATLGSKAMFERANRVLSAGVASSYQLRDPWPIYFDRGEGAYVWDVDGTKRVDFHNGFGSMVQGHAHPVITEAVTERMQSGHAFRGADRGCGRRRRGAVAAAGACRNGASPTRARNRRWTRSGSRAPTPVATPS